jgi:hypothetical protein
VVLDSESRAPGDIYNNLDCVLDALLAFIVEAR